MVGLDWVPEKKDQLLGLLTEVRRTDCGSVVVSTVDTGGGAVVVTARSTVVSWREGVKEGR